MYCDDYFCFVCFYPSTSIKYSVSICFAAHTDAWMMLTSRGAGVYLASVAFHCDIGLLF